MKKRRINRRALTLCALGLCAGIVISTGLKTGATLAVIVALALWAAFIVFAVVFRKLKLKSLAILVSLSLVLGFLTVNVQVYSIASHKIGSKEVYLKGTVTDNYYYSAEDFYVSFTLRDVVIVYDQITVDAKTQITFREYYPDAGLTGLKPGDRLSFNCQLTDMSIFKDGINTYMLRSGQYWEIDKITSEIKVENGGLKLNEQIRLHIKNAFSTRLQPRNAAVAMALVLGDKTLMDSELKTQFRQSGIAHIFAVSGLHVGFVVMAISFLFTRVFKVNKWASLILIGLGALFYQYLCGFTPSIARAIIMTLILQFAGCIGENSDLITTTSVAAFIILIFSPLYLFDAGFQLSFMAIFGIATISRSINALIMRSVEKRFIRGTLRVFSAAIGATCGTFALAAHYYGEFSLIGIVANIAVISIVGVVFLMLIAGLVPFLSFLFVVTDRLLIWADSMTMWISKQALSKIPIQSFGLAIAIVFALMIIFGGLINLSRKQKGIVSIFLVLLLAVTSFLIWQPKKINDGIYFKMDTYTDCAVITLASGEIVVLSNFTYKYDAQFVAECAAIHGKDSVILAVDNYKDLRIKNVELLMNEYGITIDEVYKLRYTLNTTADLFFQLNNVTVTLCPDYLDYASLRIETINNGSNTIANLVEINGCKVLLLNELNTFEFYLLANMIGTADAVIAKNFEDDIMKISTTPLLVTIRYPFEGFYSTKMIGTFTIRTENATIKMIS